MTLRPVSAEISAAAASRSAFVRAARATSTPSRANSSAIALPMPLLPPVTMATLPSSSISILILLTPNRIRRTARRPFDYKGYGNDEKIAKGRSDGAPIGAPHSRLAPPRHSRESGNPEGCSQARRPKSSTNSSQRIPSPFSIAPRHSRESGNPDGCSQARRPKSSTNSSQRIPSPFPISPPSFPRKRESRRLKPGSPSKIKYK